MKLGPWEIGLILVIVLIIFGAGRLTNIGKDLGKAIRGFREGAKSDDEVKQEETEPAPRKVVKSKTKDSTKTA